MLHLVNAALPHLAQPSQSPTPTPGLNTGNLASWLRDIFGPIFLVIISIVAIFFLFTREITRFVQFIVLAIGIGVVFYVPDIIETTAKAIAKALGVSVS